jgi:hypothetical protein
MLRTALIASLALIAPVAWTPGAWAQNTVVPGQWAKDVGLARGPQSTGPDSAMGYGTSTATCGPEAWSTDTMSYATLPSCSGVTGAALDRDVGFTGPVASPTSADATSSTSMLHQEMKELETAAPPPRAVLAAAATVCGSSSAGGARHSSGASCHWTARFQPAHERARCARST